MRRRARAGGRPPRPLRRRAAGEHARRRRLRGQHGHGCLPRNVELRRLPRRGRRHGEDGAGAARRGRPDASSRRRTWRLVPLRPEHAQAAPAVRPQGDELAPARRGLHRRAAPTSVASVARALAQAVRGGLPAHERRQVPDGRPLLRGQRLPLEGADGVQRREGRLHRHAGRGAYRGRRAPDDGRHRRRGRGEARGLLPEPQRDRGGIARGQGSFVFTSRVRQLPQPEQVDRLAAAGPQTARQVRAHPTKNRARLRGRGRDLRAEGRFTVGVRRQRPREVLRGRRGASRRIIRRDPDQGRRQADHGPPHVAHERAAVDRGLRRRRRLHGRHGRGRAKVPRDARQRLPAPRLRLQGRGPRSQPRGPLTRGRLYGLRRRRRSSGRARAGRGGPRAPGQRRRGLTLLPVPDRPERHEAVHVGQGPGRLRARPRGGDGGRAQGRRVVADELPVEPRRADGRVERRAVRRDARPQRRALPLGVDRGQPGRRVLGEDDARRHAPQGLHPDHHGHRLVDAARGLRRARGDARRARR